MSRHQVELECVNCSLKASGGVPMNNGIQIGINIGCEGVPSHQVIPVLTGHIEVVIHHSNVVQENRDVVEEPGAVIEEVVNGDAYDAGTCLIVLLHCQHTTFHEDAINNDTVPYNHYNDRDKERDYESERVIQYQEYFTH